MIPKIYYPNNTTINYIISLYSDSILSTQYSPYRKKLYYSDFRLFNIYCSNLFLDADCLFGFLYNFDLFKSPIDFIIK